jgi:hypothetical protein
MTHPEHGEVKRVFYSPLYCCVCNEYENGYIQQIPFLTDEIMCTGKITWKPKVGDKKGGSDE